MRIGDHAEHGILPEGRDGAGDESTGCDVQAEAANGQSRERPILLRIEPKAGHGVGKPVTKQIEELTDVYSFLFWQLGVGE